MIKKKKTNRYCFLDNSNIFLRVESSIGCHRILVIKCGMPIMISFVFLFKQVSKIEDSFDIIKSGTKPLAAYLFTNNKKLKEQFLMSVSAGGVVINDTTLHVIILL